MNFGLAFCGCNVHSLFGDNIDIKYVAPFNNPLVGFYWYGGPLCRGCRIASGFEQPFQQQFNPSINTFVPTTPTPKLPEGGRNVIAAIGRINVRVTASGIGRGSVEDFTNTDKVSVWTKNEPYSWFCVDFGEEKQIEPLAYTLRYSSDGAACCPRNWVLQGSNVAPESFYGISPVHHPSWSNWTTISVHNNDTNLNSAFGSYTWILESKDSNKNKFRYFRILQTGKNSYPVTLIQFGARDEWSDVLVVGGFEIYGKIHNKPQNPPPLPPKASYVPPFSEQSNSSNSFSFVPNSGNPLSSNPYSSSPFKPSNPSYSPSYNAPQSSSSSSKIPFTSVYSGSASYTPPSPAPEKQTSFSDAFVGEWNSEYEDSLNIKPGVFLYKVDKHKKEFDRISAFLNGLDCTINEIEVGVNPALTRMFFGSIDLIEKKEQQDEFQPKLQIESNSEERMKVLEKLKKLCSGVQHNRRAKILRVFHGTNYNVAKKIMETGFSKLSKLDDGWFGGGIYFTTHPQYALRYCSPPECLLISYVVMFNPYPVIHDDASSTSNLKLLGKSSFKHYQSHYVPVTQYGGESSMDFRPPPIGQPSKYDEVVLFNEAHILPKYVIHFTRNAQPTPPPTTTTNAKVWGVNEVVVWASKLGLSKDYSELLKSENITGTVLETMSSEEDWKQLGIPVFGDRRTLTIATKKLFS